MENKNKVVDNWECAKALDRFKQLKIDILEQRIENGNKHISTEKFKKLIPAKQLNTKNQLEALKSELAEMKKFYDAVYALVKRHENIVNELARIYVGWGDNILSKRKFPKELMDEQVKIMDEYYKSLQEMLEPCKLGGHWDERAEAEKKDWTDETKDK